MSTVGEFNIRVLLDGYLPDQEAVLASEGWDGDRFLLLENQDDNQLLLCWYTTWDTEQDAKDFFHIYAKVLEKRYTEALEPGRTAGAISEDLSRRTWNTLHGRVSLEIRGKDVLLVDGASETLGQDVIHQVWNRAEMKH